MDSDKYAELPGIQLLLANKFYKAYQPSMRASGDERVWVCREGDEIIAALRIKAYAPTELLLTGLLVAPDYRQHGIASELIQTMLRTLGNEKPGSNLYCFADASLARVYLANGFVHSCSLPVSLLQKYLRYKGQQQHLQAFVIPAA